MTLRYLPECSVPSERFDQDGLTSLHFLIGDSGLGFLPFGICWRSLLHALSASRFADGYLATGGTIDTLATLPADVAAEGCPRCGLNYAYLWRHPRIRERRRHTQCGFCGMTYFDELMAILIGDDTVRFDVLFSRGASDPVSLFRSLGMPLEPYGGLSSRMVRSLTRMRSRGHLRPIVDEICLTPEGCAFSKGSMERMRPHMSGRDIALIEGFSFRDNRPYP